MADGFASSGYPQTSGAVLVVEAHQFGVQTHSGADRSLNYSTNGAHTQRRNNPGGCAVTSGEQPHDNDLDDKPLQQYSKRHREIDERRKKNTLFSSEYLQTSNFVARGMPRWEVEKFERGKYM